MQIPNTSHRARRLWGAVFVAAALVLVAGGCWYYRSDTERIRQEKYQELAAVAKLKDGQIEQWRRERLKDVRKSSKAPFPGQAIREWLKDPDNTALQERLQHGLVLGQKDEEYADVLLLDTECRILLSASTDPHPLGPAAKQAVEQALAGRTPMLSDLYRCPRGVVHLDAVGPVRDPEGLPVAVLVLRSNVESLLYPFIQSWPTPSRTAETLLVSGQGEDVLFLNDLRHRPGGALSFRLPLSRGELPAA